MKRFIFLTAGLLMISVFTQAQKYAYVDTEYILNNIPAYKAAKEKLDELSYEWQQELESKKETLEEMEQEYQTEKVLLTDEMREKRENAIEEQRNELNELQRKYFGPEGELHQRRQDLVKPIQEEVYEAIETIASKGNYSVIFDTADKSCMLYTDPKYDKSDEVLQQLGYKK
ncbi:MAG: OmpH family outer membrane protein [Bacteroidales bacterium]